MNVVFLDFDGVVNIPWWKKVNCVWECKYNFPEDGKVNNTQAVQWVSKFCEKYNYKIVISSTWRKDGINVCVNCLRAAGLREGIDIVGCTPILDKERGHEITAWLKQRADVTGYLIFDDDVDMTEHTERLVKCRSAAGFTMEEYYHAESLHKAFNATKY